MNVAERDPTNVMAKAQATLEKMRENYTKRVYARDNERIYRKHYQDNEAVRLIRRHI
jgi:hypothetical protein